MSIIEDGSTAEIQVNTPTVMLDNKQWPGLVGAFRLDLKEGAIQRVGEPVPEDFRLFIIGMRQLGRLSKDGESSSPTEYYEWLKSIDRENGEVGRELAQGQYPVMLPDGPWLLVEKRYSPASEGRRFLTDTCRLIFKPAGSLEQIITERYYPDPERWSGNPKFNLPLATRDAPLGIGEIDSVQIGRNALGIGMQEHPHKIPVQILLNREGDTFQVYLPPVPMREIDIGRRSDKGEIIFQDRPEDDFPATAVIVNGKIYQSLNGLYVPIQDADQQGPVRISIQAYAGYDRARRLMAFELSNTGGKPLIKLVGGTDMGEFESSRNGAGRRVFRAHFEDAAISGGDTGSEALENPGRFYEYMLQTYGSYVGNLPVESAAPEEEISDPLFQP